MIQFDVTSGGTLGCGYKYDSGTNTIQFTGFEMTDAEDTVYLAFSNGTDYLLPLTNMTIEIGSPLTDGYGLMEGQLVEMSADGNFVKNSNVFDIVVKRSVNRELPTTGDEGGDGNG